MTKAISTILVAGLALCSLASAQPASTKADTDKNAKAEHHSKLSKVAFWHHHNDASKNAKTAKQTPSKSAPAKTAQTKTTAAKQTTAKKDQKQEVASNTNKSVKPVTRKAPVAHATKPASKSKDEKDTPPLKQ